MARKYTKEILSEAVQHNTTMSGVLRYLGLSSTSGSVWSTLRKYIKEYDIDISHFTGQSHAKGKISNKRLPPERILKIIDTSYRTTAKRLRRALIEVGVPYVCGRCGLGNSWQGLPITLEVDHIDGNWHNCQQKNLRFLCPNCHSQMLFSKNRPVLNKVVCPNCGIERDLHKAPSIRHCSICASKKRGHKKGNWPSNEELLKLVWLKPVSVLANEIGVSGSVIKKRCKQLGISTPPRGYWAKDLIRRKEVTCFTCGKTTTKTLSALAHSKSGVYFCSRVCQDKSHRPRKKRNQTKITREDVAQLVER